MEKFITHPRKQTLTTLQYNIGEHNDQSIRALLKDKVNADLIVSNTGNVASYEDYVRLRNQAVKNDLSILLLCPTVPLMINQPNVYLKAINIVDVAIIFNKGYMRFKKIRGVIFTPTDAQTRYYFEKIKG